MYVVLNIGNRVTKNVSIIRLVRERVCLSND